jgi:hypothetical protein
MKRSVVALGILGLVYAVALPAAHAAILYQDDFSTDKFLKDKGTYVQGLTDAIRADSTLLPAYIRDGYLTFNPPDGGTSGADGTGANHDPTSYDTPQIDDMILFGDAKWADVAIQALIRSDGQNTGRTALILRAAPKTKPTDPDTRYEMDYITANSAEGAGNATKETITPQMDASAIDPADSVPAIRIYKAVNGKFKVLGEVNFDTAKTPIPEVNAAGPDNDPGATFRFVAKGNVLQAWAQLPGKAAVKYLEVTDDELKAGLVGLAASDYNPNFDNLLVEDAP